MIERDLKVEGTIEVFIFAILGTILRRREDQKLVLSKSDNIQFTLVG